MASLRLPQRITARHFWHNFDTFLFDGGGTLWRDLQPRAGAIAIVNALLEAGKRVFVVTNNETQSCKEYVHKCRQIGFSELDEQHIVSSSMVLAYCLNKMKQNVVKFGATAHLPIYLVGSVGLQRQLKEKNIESFGTGPDTTPADIYSYANGLPNMDLGIRRPFAVVGSFDIHMSYAKVMRATNWLKDASVPFLVTNEDAAFPGPDPDMVIPGAGSVTSVLRYVSGREPLVMGKPSSICWEYIVEKVGGNAQPPLDPLRTVMIGDRCETDMQFGRVNGLSTLLVLSGFHSLADVEHFRAAGRALLVPEFYSNSLADFCCSERENRVAENMQSF